MISKGYIVAKFNNNGMGRLSVNIDNLYTQIFFKTEESAKNILDKLKNIDNMKGLLLIQTSVYVANKIIYEDNEDLINSMDLSLFAMA